MFIRSLSAAKVGESGIRLSPNQSLNDLDVNNVPLGLVVPPLSVLTVAGRVEAGSDVSGQAADSGVGRDFAVAVGLAGEYRITGFNILEISVPSGGGWILPMGSVQAGSTYGVFVRALSGEVGLQSGVGGVGEVWRDVSSGWALLSSSRRNGIRSVYDGVDAGAGETGYLFGGGAGLKILGGGAGVFQFALPAVISGAVDLQSPLEWLGHPGFDDGAMHNGSSGL